MTLPTNAPRRALAAAALLLAVAVPVFAVRGLRTRHMPAARPAARRSFASPPAAVDPVPAPPGDFALPLAAAVSPIASAAPTAVWSPAARVATVAAPAAAPGHRLPHHRRHRRRRDLRPPVDPLMRIGLERYFDAAPGVVVPAPAGAVLCDSAGQPVLQGPMQWRFFVKAGKVAVCDNTGWLYGMSDRWHIAPPADGTPLSISRPGESREHRYRGALEIYLALYRPMTLQLVNVVRLETYLRGVLGDEMPGSGELEALRAQAVAARTYALTDCHKFRARGFDLSDVVTSQMYGGVDAEAARTDEAVRSTAGMVVTRRGRLVLTDYCDDCGGATAVEDGPDGRPSYVVDAPPGGGPDYCAAGTYHQWTLTVPPDEMRGRLASRGGVGRIADIRVVATDPSGRVSCLDVEGDRGHRELTGEQLRALFGYRRMRSTHFSVTREPNGAFVFEGKGWGHGHGLCQWGAMGLASAPYSRTCREILAHYYPHTTLSDLRDVAPRQLARR